MWLTTCLLQANTISNIFKITSLCNVIVPNSRAPLYLFFLVLHYSFLSSIVVYQVPLKLFNVIMFSNFSFLCSAFSLHFLTFFTYTAHADLAMDSKAKQVNTLHHFYSYLQNKNPTIGRPDVSSVVVVFQVGKPPTNQRKNKVYTHDTWICCNQL
jgi:hypothetical protein